MQSATATYAQFQRKVHSQQQILSSEDFTQQIARLQQLKPRLATADKQTIDKYVKIYQVASREIQRMKRTFTKPNQFNQRLVYILDNEIQQNIFQGLADKTSEIRSSEIQIPTFKKPTSRQNTIEVPEDKAASPGLTGFFDKKFAQINLARSRSNFKSVLQGQQNKDLSRSISRQQSRSSGSSFMKKPGHQAQLKRVLEENKKIKQEYEKKLKKELELSDFEKKLLKDEKDRYMQKIEQLERELEKLSRANYKLKEEVEIKEKTLKQKSQFGNSQSFRNVDQDIQKPIPHGKDYFQPYVMQTKKNDLKRLNKKFQSEYEPSQVYQSQPFVSMSQKNNFNGNHGNQLQEDILGPELERELEEIDRKYSRSHQSSREGKKPGSGQNLMNNDDADELRSVLQRIESEDDLPPAKNTREPFQQSSSRNGSNNHKKIFSAVSSKNAFQKKSEHSFSHEQSLNNFAYDNPPINILPPSMNRKPSNQPSFNVTHSTQQLPSQPYEPQSNYSFTKAINKDYSLTSNPTGYDTFQMTKTYLNLQQNEESETNKYIDARTATRNKVAFFKDSLILVKNQTFQLAFKRSALVNTKDRVRVIFFVKNKTSRPLTVTFRYEYDAAYFKLKVNERIDSIPPNGQARQDLEIYGYSTLDLNQVIDVLVEVDSHKYGLWMPVLWIEFQGNDRFKLPDKNEEISFIPDRQFKNYQSAKTVMPLMQGGKDSQSQWAYLYGVCKFGPCFVKLTWDGSQLKIQTDARWIDLLAFAMHHVK